MRAIGWGAIIEGVGGDRALGWRVSGYLVFF